MKSKIRLLAHLITITSAVYLSVTANAAAGTIATRNELVGQLGAGAITENFETFVLPPDGTARVGTNLNSDSVVAGQGPGLVKPGLTFIQSPAREGLQWDRQFGYGLLSEALVSDKKMIIDFANPVTHVGFNMFWYHTEFAPANPTTVEVYGPDKASLLYTTNIFEPFAPDFYFFGYADGNGIGRIILFRQEGSSLGVTALIDDLTFGFAPILSITSANGEISLSWTQTATNFQLEAATNLNDPVNWVPVPNTPTPANGLKTVSLPPGEASVFFRLHAQE
jgi:hypothetical protein